MSDKPFVAELRETAFTQESPDPRTQREYAWALAFVREHKHRFHIANALRVRCVRVATMFNDQADLVAPGMSHHETMTLLGRAKALMLCLRDHGFETEIVCHSYGGCEIGTSIEMRMLEVNHPEIQAPYLGAESPQSKFEISIFARW